MKLQYVKIKKKDLRGRFELNIDKRILKGSFAIDPEVREEMLESVKHLLEEIYQRKNDRNHTSI